MRTIKIPEAALLYVLRERDPDAVLWELMDWDSPAMVRQRWKAYERMAREEKRGAEGGVNGKE